MNELKKIKQFAGEIGWNCIPVVITTIVHLVWGKNLLLWANIVLLILSYLISAVVILLFNKQISKAKRYRTYKKYEGKWIEIIPGFSRSISICNLYFRNDGYHFDGANYSGKKGEPVHFKSKRFIENSKNDFYYITKNDSSVERFEGFGKIYALSDSDRGFYVGKGYFFDVSSKGDQKVHKTIMIKFDKRFYDHYLNLRRDENPLKFTDRDIYEHVIDYVEENYNLEVSL